MLLKDYIPNINKRYNKIFFSGISADSSKVKKDNIFFAIKGNKFDGNNYIDLAIKKGDYSDADKIREELDQMGVVLEDKDGQTSWKLK